MVTSTIFVVSLPKMSTTLDGQLALPGPALGEDALKFQGALLLDAEGLPFLLKNVIPGPDFFPLHTPFADKWGLDQVNRPHFPIPVIFLPRCCEDIF